MLIFREQGSRWPLYNVDKSARYLEFHYYYKHKEALEFQVFHLTRSEVWDGLYSNGHNKIFSILIKKSFNNCKVTGIQGKGVQLNYLIT